MKTTISDIEKKRGRGRPSTDSTPLLVRLLPMDIEELDAWIARQAEPMTRPQAIRHVLREWLAVQKSGRKKIKRTD